jgi:putative hemolysin
VNHHWLVVAAAFALTVASPFVAPVAHAQEEGDSATAQWCASHQGTVVDRYPASNASSDAPVGMGPTVRFCEFSGGEGAEPPDSRISVRLTTLASDQPSMAATAYLTKPEMAESGGSANPASVYCADLGGVEMGGQLAPDGGWVNGVDASDVVQMCVFPDLSIIDSWGLAYHAMGTIRGADLEPLFRWKPESSG